MHPDLGLDAAYRARLGIAPSDPLPPDGNTLRRLVELHLRRIPFENLSLHGAGGGPGDGAAAADDDAADADEPPIPLSLPLLRDKILLRKRGGCCLELNGLLGHYLLELGYPVVRLVPGWVCAGPERGHGRSGGGHGGHGSHSRRRQRAKFRTRQTHAFLLVRTRPPSAAASGASGAGGKGSGESYLVDVGLGEPPLRPLEYGPAALGAPQLTPDGMRSRIVREGRAWTDGRGRARRCLRMEWWRPCRGCFERRQDRGGGGGKGSDDSAAEAGAAEAGAAEAVPRLEKEARRLRSQADRARRKAAARPRPPFKVYASDASVREEARRRWVGRVRSNGAEASAPAPDAGTTSSSSKNDAGENERIRREICDMWATLPRDGREQYQHVALAEVADLREKARAALQKAEHAEALLREAATRRKSVASAKSTDRCSSSIWRCDEQCTGEGGYWEPRIQWDVSDAPLEPTEGEPSFVDDRPLESFADAAAIVASEGSTFRSKIVVCALTRSEKITLAGNHLRITRPRFPPCSLRRQGDGDGDDEDKNRWPVQTRKHLSSKEDILAALADCFDLDSKQLSDLNVGDPSSSPLSGNECRLWEHL